MKLRCVLLASVALAAVNIATAGTRETPGDVYVNCVKSCIPNNGTLDLYQICDDNYGICLGVQNSDPVKCLNTWNDCVSSSAKNFNHTVFECLNQKCASSMPANRK